MKTKLSTLCDKIIEAGWLATLIAVPLFFNIYTARTFEPDKITLLRSIALVMSLAWLVAVVERGGFAHNSSTSWAERFRGWLRQPLFLPTLILVVVYLVSTAFSLSPLVSFWGSYQRLQGTYSALSYIVIFALMAGTLRTQAQVDRLVTTIIVASVPVSLYGIVQRYGLDPLPWAGDVTARVASTMGNAIFVSSYLIMVLPLTLSRLIESMTAIIKEEAASWGHTILSAVYIFILAIQILTIIFSQSRGPMLGVLGGGFVMGLLFILILRQTSVDSARLSLTEIGQGILFVVPLGVVSALAGGVGYLLGGGLQNLLTGYQVSGLSLLGAALGVILGFFGTYTYMAASGKGRRWLWLSWLGVAAAGILVLLLLNWRGTGFDSYLDPLRRVPGLDRLSQVTGTESGTGRVRVLIWDAALKLVQPHEPLGIPADEVVPLDSFNAIRPLIGYGPESMFNAFAFVYPPELAHVEARGSSADRSHNETVDSLVITGLLGFLAFYFLMVQLFYYAISWLGWAADRAAKQRLYGFLVGGGLVGALVAYFAAGGLTFVPLGLPFGLLAGMLLHLIWQGVVSQAPNDKPGEARLTLLLIGVLGAIIGHFIEVHFVFSIAATYTYFWAYAGLLVALSKMMTVESEATADNAVEAAASEPEETVSQERGSKRGKKRRSQRGRQSGPAPIGAFGVESWATWLGGQGLAIAMILIILTFNFITPQFEFQFGDADSMSLLWMFTITWVIGLAVALSDVAVHQEHWTSPISWPRAAALYSVSSLFYFFFYWLAHRIQFSQRITVNSPSDVLNAANVLANGLLLFYLALLLLMLLFAVILSWGQFKQRLNFWRAENWWLYPPLVVAILALIWFKNVNVVRADIYLKEGDRYRSQSLWQEAIALHDQARTIDSDEDFYYLMLALDYQLMAQDGRLDQATRSDAWGRGEQIALEARRINPYNPDNTGNMGRYYFTVAQVFDRVRFEDALDFFEKAVILAPSNVIYHNLWAQTHYILQDYPAAIDRLKVSIAVDPKYPPTWALLGDTYAALGNVDEALAAHSQAMALLVRGSDGMAVFADQFLDQRLNFYVSAGRLEDIVAALKKVAAERPDNARAQVALGRAYSLAGQPEQAQPYFEQALTLGDNSPQTAQALADIHMANNNYEQALPLYEFAAQRQPNAQINSALAFIYAQQGRLPDAIQQNQLVLQQLPNDYDSLKNLALLYQQTGQLQESLTAAQQAREIAPETDRPSWEPFIANLEAQLAATGSP